MVSPAIPDFKNHLRDPKTIDSFTHQARDRLRENTGRMANEAGVQFNGGQIAVRHNTARSVAVFIARGLIAGRALQTR